MPRFLRGIAPILLVVLVGLSLAQEPPRLYALPDARARLVMSGSMAAANEGRFLITANMLNNTVSIVEPLQSAVRAELPVGKDPRSVAVTPDNTKALVINRGDSTLSVIDLGGHTELVRYPVGVLPYGVIAQDNTYALITVQGMDEVIQLDINTGEITARIPVADSPAGIALWGNLLYVSHLWTGQLTLIYLSQLRVIDMVSSGSDVGLSQSIYIDAQRGLAYLPQTRMNAQNQALTFDATVAPVVNVFDLQDLSLMPLSQITLDTADRPVNMPFATVLDSQRRWLYVANAGSNSISVIDVTSGLAVNHIATKSNPRNVLLSRDNGTLYIHNMIEGTITLIDTRSFRVIDEIPMSVLSISSDVYVGAQFFNSATDSRTTADQWMSCASCHFDGLSDGRVWQGYIDGPRNTPVLFNLNDYTVFNAAGTWDELADLELKIRFLQGGHGLIDGQLSAGLGDPHEGLSPDLDTLTAYLLTLEGPESSFTADPEQIERGQTIFNEQNCASCHVNEIGTDELKHDVGTGGEFVTPTLRWLWLSQPYFHDGSAPTLLNVFIAPGTHQLIQTVSYEDIQALVAYLNTLPQN